MAKPVIWFWQQIATPHMVGLTLALARQGREVVYVTGQLMSADRARQGWSFPQMSTVPLKLVTTIGDVKAMVQRAPEDSIHVCEGIRANGVVSKAQQVLDKRGLRQWVVMEAVDDAGWRGRIKRMHYQRLVMHARSRTEGLLAIGDRTSDWVVARGMPAKRVYPFAYFLPNRPNLDIIEPETNTRYFRFLFVGQFIERKRLDLLIRAMATLQRQDIELAVIGTGPLEQRWRAMAETIMPGRVEWIGLLPMEQVQTQMVSADCLVLPSRHDGWGAVVSEALMVGTPVICSNGCGSAEVVTASGVGGVFPSGDLPALAELLERTVQAGKFNQSKRNELAKWASCLGADAGTAYLQAIVENAEGNAKRPTPPWLVSNIT